MNILIVGYREVKDGTWITRMEEWWSRHLALPPIRPLWTVFGRASERGQHNLGSASARTEESPLRVTSHSLNWPTRTCTKEKPFLTHPISKRHSKTLKVKHYDITQSKTTLRKLSETFEKIKMPQNIPYILKSIMVLIYFYINYNFHFESVGQL